MNHLAIYSTKAFGEDYIKMMLDGVKTIDSKFSYRRVPPYERLSAGDTIYLKESSGPIRGRVRVVSVTNARTIDSSDIMSFLEPCYVQLGIKNKEHLEQVWKAHASKNYVCQWKMAQPEKIRHPVYIYKRDMRSWIVDYDVPEEVLGAFI